MDTEYIDDNDDLVNGIRLDYTAMAIRMQLLHCSMGSSGLIQTGRYKQDSVRTVCPAACKTQELINDLTETGTGRTR